MCEKINIGWLPTQTQIHTTFKQTKNNKPLGNDAINLLNRMNMEKKMKINKIN